MASTDIGIAACATSYWLLCTTHLLTIALVSFLDRFCNVAKQSNCNLRVFYALFDCLQVRDAFYHCSDSRWENEVNRSYTMLELNVKLSSIQ